MWHAWFVSSDQGTTVDAELAGTVSASEYATSRLTNFLVTRTEELFACLQQIVCAHLCSAGEVALAGQSLSNYSICFS